MPKKIEIAPGEVFNKLTYLHDVQRRGHSRMALFKCTCGTTKELPVNPVRTGLYKSCGCSHRNGKHGHCKGEETSLYRRWGAMKYRCETPTSPDYHRYGGRGITICPEWQDFKVFAKWAYDSGFVEHLTLDRRDNNKGYFPANCRWVTLSTQAANQNKINGTKFKHIGVRQMPSGNWSARLNHKNKRISLGAFPSEMAAVNARNAYIIANNLPHTLAKKEVLRDV